MLLSQDQIEDDYVRELTVYPSLYAYHAYSTGCVDAPIDALVQTYYLDASQQSA